MTLVEAVCVFVCVSVVVMGMGNKKAIYKHPILAVSFYNLIFAQ